MSTREPRVWQMNEAARFIVARAQREYEQGLRLVLDALGVPATAKTVQLHDDRVVEIVPPGSCSYRNTAAGHRDSERPPPDVRTILLGKNGSTPPTEPRVWPMNERGRFILDRLKQDQQDGLRLAAQAIGVPDGVGVTFYPDEAVETVPEVPLFPQEQTAPARLPPRETEKADDDCSCRNTIPETKSPPSPPPNDREKPLETRETAEDTHGKQ